MVGMIFAQAASVLLLIVSDSAIVLFLLAGWAMCRGVARKALPGFEDDVEQGCYWCVETMAMITCERTPRVVLYCLYVCTVVDSCTLGV